MWQRFTERARRVVFFAQEEAGNVRQREVHDGHLLLGILREPDSVACRILKQSGISLQHIREAIAPLLERGDGKDHQAMQLTPIAKLVIDFAYDEAKTLMNNYIGTEHLLLGLMRAKEGIAHQVLVAVGAELEELREITRKIGRAHV